MLARLKALANRPEWKFMPNRPLLTALLAADLFFIVLHILYLLPADVFPFFQEEPFSIKRDAGVAESFQYVKQLWIIIIFLWLVIRQRRTSLLGLAALFGYFLLDDMIQIHETLGDLAAGLFANLPVYELFSRLEADDFGELFAVGIIVLLFLGFIALFYRRAAPDTRRIFHVVFALLGVFIFFGVAVDFVTGFISQRVLRELFMLAEDGGEMLAMSLVCWYASTLVGEVRLRDGG